MFGFKVVDGFCNRLSESVKVGKSAGAERQLFHQFPNTLNQIQVRRVRRQEQKFDVERFSQFTNDSCAMIRRIVQYDRHRLAAAAMNRSQQLANLLGADRPTVDHRNHLCRAVANRTEHVQPLAARAGGNKQTYRAPEVTQKRTIHKMRCVEEEDVPLARVRLFQARLKLFFLASSPESVGEFWLGEGSEVVI